MRAGANPLIRVGAGTCLQPTQGQVQSEKTTWLSSTECQLGSYSA